MEAICLQEVGFWTVAKIAIVFSTFTFLTNIFWSIIHGGIRSHFRDK